MTKPNNKLKAGDKVSWTTSQSNTKGTLIKKITKDTKIKRHKVAASNDDPSYLVQSDKTKKLPAHKPTAIKKNPKNSLTK